MLLKTIKFKNFEDISLINVITFKIKTEQNNGNDFKHLPFVITKIKETNERMKK